MPSHRPTADRAVLIVLDGLRPEFVTDELMPHLTEFAAGGVRFTDSHAVLPTVTRCNSATIASGTLPRTHGIPGNRFVARALESAHLNAGDHRDLERLRKIRNGTVTFAPTLADAIHEAGGRTVVLGTGTPGAAVLQNPEAGANGDVLIHPAVVEGVEMAAVVAAFGPIPKSATPATELNRYFTRLATEFVIPELRPELLIFWHTDPDRSQHAEGPGTEQSLRALRDADVNVAAILGAVEADTVVAILSDHGFVTNTGTVDIEARLRGAGLLDAGSEPAHVASGLVYLDGVDEALERRIADALMVMPEVGGLFTRHRVPGTFPLEKAGAGGPEGPDILYGLSWDRETNDCGIEGRAWSHPMAGAGNHGSFSPYEVRNTAIIAGPGLQVGFASELPMGNVDVAPTLASLLGVALPLGDGRVLTEALEGADSLRVEREIVETSYAGRRQTMPTATVAGSIYVDYVAVERS